MKINEGAWDRVLRVVVGLAVLGMGYFMYEMAWWMWLGLIPLVTGLVGYCPLYSLFGCSTCKVNAPSSSFHDPNNHV